MGTTMGAAFGRMVRLMPSMVDSGLVCQRCKDNKKCSDCVFKTTVSNSEKSRFNRHLKQQPPAMRRE
jgi:hypothetical protein